MAEERKGRLSMMKKYADIEQLIPIFVQYLAML